MCVSVCVYVWAEKEGGREGMRERGKEKREKQGLKKQRLTCFKERNEFNKKENEYHLW